MPRPISYFLEIPACPVCLDTLGRCGGPATLPCGHNGCKDCLEPLLLRRDSRCPLCRKVFLPGTQISVNHELRDLVALATMLCLDETEKADGWEAFPDPQTAARSYKDDVKQRIEEDRHRGLDSWPSAPQLSDSHGEAARDILALEPPHWLPDSYASACGGCHLQFRPLTRLKHHCRMCGKIFCNSCCHKRMLLPPKFPHREPQRVCELCSTLLQPLQPFLAGTQAAAVQPPVHDSIDSVSLRSWVNSPWSSSLEGDVFKAANIVQTFTRALRLSPEAGLTAAVLQGCRALVLLSSAKLGAGWSCSLGTGLIVARNPSGSWSAPCAVACYGMGWGLQVGGELTDLLLVLRTEEQLRACCGGRPQLGLGGNLGLAVGMVGRHADACVKLGMHGCSTPIYSYSCSKGAFVGAALEGSIMVVRPAVNEKFYGYCVTAEQLLLHDSIPQPPAASTLYDALHGLANKYEIRAPLTPAQLRQYHLEQPRSPQTLEVPQQGAQLQQSESLQQHGPQQSEEALPPPPPPLQQQQQQQGGSVDVLDEVPATAAALPFSRPEAAAALPVSAATITQWAASFYPPVASVVAAPELFEWPSAPAAHQQAGVTTNHWPTGMVQQGSTHDDDDHGDDGDVHDDDTDSSVAEEVADEEIGGGDGLTSSEPDGRPPAYIFSSAALSFVPWSGADGAASTSAPQFSAAAPTISRMQRREPEEDTPYGCLFED